MKKWKVLNKLKVQSEKLKINEIVKILLKNRGVKTKKEIEEFLDPKLEKITVKGVGIDSKNLKRAIERVKLAIRNREQIIVFGDYDVDGICGTAILWETLNTLGARVMPYIPHRIDEGYGLSIKGIQNVQDKYKNVKLIITVDNGIVANKAVEFANKQKIDVIITDHHVPSKKLPNAFAIVQTTNLCGTGVAYLLSRVILNLFQDPKEKKMLKPASQRGEQVQHDNLSESHLGLVALATVADLVPLKGSSRTLLKFGLEALGKTKRVGLLELLKEAGLEKNSIGVYEIGHVIAPRLNAMGRLEYAMDSLRLLCTNNRERARMLAQTLGNTNRERQELTIGAVEHAKEKIKSLSRAESRDQKLKIKNLVFIAHETYQQGVIGLVAGKLVEEFYRPAIVVSVGEKYSKASARSISGFNIIEFIRGVSELLIDAGGHPMAAGFTVETTKLVELQKALEDRAELILNKDLLTRSLRIDCELQLSYVNEKLYSALQRLAPFGIGNPEPTFLSKNAVVEDMRLVGTEGKHLKLKFRIHNSEFRIDGIAFGVGERSPEFHIGDMIDMVYTIDENEWNGGKSLQIKIKDIVKK